MMYNKTLSRTFRLFIVGFNIFTVVLYATAPLNYASSNGFLLSICYLAFACFLINQGYKAGERKTIDVRLCCTKIFYSASTKLINIFFGFYSLTFLVKYAYLLRFSPFDITGMISFLSLGLADPYWAYHNAISDTRPYTISWGVYFLISIINHLFFIFGFLTFGKQNRHQKILFCFFVALEMFYWMGRATNFGVIALVLTFFISRFLTTDNTKEISKSQIAKIVALGVMAFPTAVFFFGNTMNSRTEGADATGNFLQTNSGIFEYLPQEFWSPYYYVVSYLCQGYYNLSLALGIDHIDWTFGLGNNPALISLSDFVFGTDLMEHTYMKSLDMQCQVDEFAAWHSAYLWWANDFTSLGALVIVYFLAYIIGFSYRISMSTNDFLSKIVCVVTTCMVVMLFANNTYLSSVFYSYMFLFPIWVVTRFKNRV